MVGAMKLGELIDKLEEARRLREKIATDERMIDCSGKSSGPQHVFDELRRQRLRDRKSRLQALLEEDLTP